MKPIQNLIVLIGKPNSNKTATMHHVVRGLEGNKDDVKWIRRSKFVQDDCADFTVQMEYRGKKIYLASRGDDRPPMEAKVEAIIKGKFEIAVVVISAPAEDGASKAVYEYYCNEMKAKVSNLIEVEKEHFENPSTKAIADSTRKASESIIKAINDIIDKMTIKS